jgi:hypothetical protein
MALSILIFGQSKLASAPFIIVSNIHKSNYFYGDTIFFTIKNNTQIERGYTIEASCIVANSKLDPIYYGAIYTAYFNNDTSFFVSLKKRIQIYKEEQIGYLLPNGMVIPHIVSADSSSTFFYILSGNKTKNGIKLKLRIIPDIKDDEPDYNIETKSFRLFIDPIYK